MVYSYQEAELPPTKKMLLNFAKTLKLGTCFFGKGKYMNLLKHSMWKNFFLKGSILLIFLFILVFAAYYQSNIIDIVTAPGGADIYLDNEPVGQTPTEIKIPRSAQELRIEFQSFSTPTRSKLSPKNITRTVTAAYLPLTANLPLFIALEKGFFKQNGIDVKAIEATSPNHIITGIVSGKIDFAAVLAYSLLFPAANRYPGICVVFLQRGNFTAFYRKHYYKKGFYNQFIRGSQRQKDRGLYGLGSD